MHREEGRRRDGDERGNGRLEENGRGRRKRRNRDMGMKKKNIRGEAGGEEYHQSGFRPGHSTKNVLIKTIDDWPAQRAG